MQFQVPQFIDIEDKIVGPLTLRQFFYLAVAGGMSFFLFFIFSFGLWLFVTVVIGSLAASLAFVKYNGQSLTRVLVNAFFYFWRPRLYLWQSEIKEKTVTLKIPQIPNLPMRNVLSGMPNMKKLWQAMLTTKNPIPQREKYIITQPVLRRSTPEKFQVLRRPSGEKELAKRIDY
jgi:hypothetical protein